VVNQASACCPACTAPLVFGSTGPEDGTAYRCAGCTGEWNTRDTVYCCPCCGTGWPAEEPCDVRRERLCREFRVEVEQAFRELGPPVI